MGPLRVAVVSRDPTIRLEAARAFDSAPASWSVRLFDSPPDHADVVVFGPDADPGDGLVFDPSEPQRMLREIASSANAARIMVVTGARRGLGVTSIGLHLAAASARSYKTCFVDCDEWGAASRLGLGETPALATENPSDEAVELAAVPAAGGFRILLTDRFEQPLEVVLNCAARVFDLLVVDAPDEPGLTTALDAARAAFLVISPTGICAARGREVIQAHKLTRWGVVVNRLGPGGEATRGELERILGHRIALELPCAPALRDAEDDCSLLSTSWSRWLRRVDDLCQAMVSA